MNILVYGAGVIGSLYASRLRSGGHRVSLLARGQRLRDIRRHGVVLEDMSDGTRSTVAVEAIERLLPDDCYDVIIATVRREQLASILPVLAANQPTPTVLFMLNNPIGSATLIKALGERVLLGFPGAGGAREGHVVRFAMIAQQPTTLGEPSGRHTARLGRIVEELRTSGFKTTVTSDMDAWLKAHAFFVTAISGALYLAGGECQQLSKDDAVLRLMVAGVREGFGAVRALGLSVRPFALRMLFTWLPSGFAVRYWRRFFRDERADYVFGCHSQTAFIEMRTLADDCRTLLQKTGVKQPALRRLYEAIDTYADR